MMRFLKKLIINFAVLALMACVPVGAWAQTALAEIVNFSTVRLDKQLAVSAQIKFDLPSSIEEAMYKGVSLTFVSELEITRDRWYWSDKQIVTARRQVRISYQALTRRWRVQPWSDMGGVAGLGVQLAQTYETLPEALMVAQRIHNWRVADIADINDSQHWVVLRYRLDTSQLPKPLQIGVLGQGDWSISTVLRQRLSFQEAN